MDALTLLREVSDAYRNLQTLELMASLIDESGDENANQHSERRVRFFYAAPDRMRYEPCGKGGILQVADGKQVHTCFGHHPGLSPRYTSVPLAQMGRSPHRFNPEWPAFADALLFQGIDERVVSAEILRQEDGCYVVAVEYEQQSQDQVLMVHGSPILFWVDERNRTVMRRQGKSGHRFPTEDEISWSEHSLLVREMRINGPIPEETFHFTPPPDAMPDGSDLGGSVGWGIAGGGSIHYDSDETRRFESHRTFEWEGDAVVDRTKWKIRGKQLTFERRLTFSEDETELRIDERITGPKGEVETSCKLPVA